MLGIWLLQMLCLHNFLTTIEEAKTEVPVLERLELLEKTC